MENSRSSTVSTLLFVMTAVMVLAYFLAKEPGLSLQELSLHSEVQSNGGSALEVDLVVVMDHELLAQLPAGSHEWFDQRERLLAQYHDDLHIATLQVVSAYDESAIALPEGYRRAAALLVYSNYLGEDQSRLSLDPEQSRATLDLGPQRAELHYAVQSGS